jgi:hypothetical protein
MPWLLLLYANSVARIKKGRFRPRAGHKCPQREYRYSSTLSLTSAPDRGGQPTPRPGRFVPRNDTWYSLYRRLGGPQGRSEGLQKMSPPPGFNPRNVHPVASSLYRLRRNFRAAGSHLIISNCSSSFHTSYLPLVYSYFNTFIIFLYLIHNLDFHLVSAFATPIF